jgi:hypothetical protein
MKKIVITVCLGFVFNMGYSQMMYSYKEKTKTNSKDRTMMLDIFRANLYEDFKQEFVFVVDVFNVCNNYAWFRGSVQRKDGKKVKLDEDYDCCHVEALFKKSNGKWLIVESGAFSTDVWYDGLWDRMNKVPRKIFALD